MKYKHIDVFGVVEYQLITKKVSLKRGNLSSVFFFKSQCGRNHVVLINTHIELTILKRCITLTERDTKKKTDHWLSFFHNSKQFIFKTWLVSGKQLKENKGGMGKGDKYTFHIKHIVADKKRGLKIKDKKMKK